MLLAYKNNLTPNNLFLNAFDELFKPDGARINHYYREDDKSFIVYVDLPEVKKEDVVIDREGNYLMISANRHYFDGTNKKYETSFRISNSSEIADISGELKDGVL